MEVNSYVIGRGDIEPLYTTVPALLDLRVLQHPSKPAFVFRSPAKKDDSEISRKVITFEDLASVSLRLAGAFLKIGIEPKDTALLLGSNCPEYVYVDHAFLRISVLMLRIPLNVGTFSVAINALKTHRVSTLVLDDFEMATKLNEEYPGVLSDEESKYGIRMKHVLLLKQPTEDSKWKSISQVLMNDGCSDQVSKIQSEQQPKDRATAFSTSGSTGDPKHVVHSHFGTINTFKPQLYKLSSKDIVIMYNRPFSWLGGDIYHAVLASITLIIVEPGVLGQSNVANLFVQIAREEQATVAVVMAYILHDIQITFGSETNVETLKHIVTTGELIPLELLSYAKETFGRVTVDYGSTENCAQAIASQQHLDGESIESLHLLTVSPGREMRLVEDASKIVKVGEIGNVQIRSLSMFEEYLDDKESTLKAKLESGWFCSGDIGKMDNEGNIQVLGRVKDVISRGGNMIYPALIEKEIINHPQVAKVAVVGVPDDRLFNEVCAFIIRKPDGQLTEAELHEFLTNKTLQTESIAKPKYYIFIDDFPRLSTGKVDKKSLTKFAISRLQLKG